MTTRFRAYRLANEGSSYSYFDGSHFTLFEARLTNDNRPSIYHELARCGKTSIDTLHITSWDKDHCEPKELRQILDDLKPSHVDVPGYNPKNLNKKQSLSSKESWEIVDEWKTYQNTLRRMTPGYLATLSPGTQRGNSNIVFWPKEIDKDNANNNSTVMLFRGGHFNLLSPGDIESESAAHRLMGYLGAETHVLILPHHGSEHGIINKTLIDHLSPNVAVCTANYKNKFNHPRPSVRNVVSSSGIPLCTTKMGDVIIECADGVIANVYDYKINRQNTYDAQKTMWFYV